MIIGYARISALDPETGVEAQLRDLASVGCDRVFIEQVSSVDVASREQLALALESICEGDTLVTTKLDRLARSMTHLVGIMDRLRLKGAHLRVLNMGIDTATPNGKLMLTILGGVAEFEREIASERKREGIAKAKAEGKYKGRKPTARAKADEIKALAAEGVSQSTIASKLGIAKSSVHRVLRAARNP